MVYPPSVRVGAANNGVRPGNKVVTPAVVASPLSKPALVVVTVAFVRVPPATPVTVSRPVELIDTVPPAVAVPRHT